MSRTRLLAALFLGAAATAGAFSAVRRIAARPPPGRASRRSASGENGGGSGNDVSLGEDGGANVVTNEQKRKAGSAAGERGERAGGEEAAISPLLAEWAKEVDDKEAARPLTTSKSASAWSPPSMSSTSLGGIGNYLIGGGQGSRRSPARAQSARMEEILEDIDAMLRAPRCDVPELLSLFRSLANLYSEFQNKDRALMPTLESLISRRPLADEKKPAYRLAWVGSDEAICHVDTSVHVRPLARLQEIYLLLGYGNWELLEVIQPGPLPNVIASLKGEVKARRLGAASEREGVRLEIGYTRIVDGTGLEILARGDSNAKRVDLDVWFANGRCLVCTMPQGKGGRSARGDPLDGDGSRILFFVREDDLDGELERLCAA